MCTPATFRSRSSGSTPPRVPQTRTKVMLIVGDPSRAFALSAIPNAGVGLARTEFIVTNHIGIHPMALARYPHLKDAEAVKEIARADRRRGRAASSSSAGSARASPASRRRSIRSRSSCARATSRRTSTPHCSAAASSSRPRRIRCSASAARRDTTIRATPTDSRSSAPHCSGLVATSGSPTSR